MNRQDKTYDLPDDEQVVFIPANDLRTIEQAIHRMEQAQQEFCKLREKLKQNDPET